MSSRAVPRAGPVEQLRQELEERILAGEFPPGAALRESVLAERLGVSRNSMREAVRGMVPGRLVHHLPNRGFVVTQLTAAEIGDIFRAREALEAAAIRDRFPQAREKVDELERVLARLERCARRRDWTGVFRQDREFHAVLVRLLGSERLDRTFADLFGELRVALAQVDRQDADPDRLVAEHRSLLDPMRAGDRRAAERAVRQLLRGAARTLVERVAASGRPASR